MINIFFIMFGWYSPNIESFQALLIAFYWKLTAYAHKENEFRNGKCVTYGEWEWINVCSIPYVKLCLCIYQIQMYNEGVIALLV